MCNNFSDAFVGGRLARTDKWENVVFGIVSTFQQTRMDRRPWTWTFVDVCGTLVKQFGTFLEWLSVELDLSLFAVDVCATSSVFVLSVVCLVFVLGVAVSVDSLGTGGSSLESLANTCNWIG